MRLDRVDKSILAELQRDGRLTNRELAERANLSESACLRRVRGLEEAGVIDRYAALVNQAKVGLPGNVFVSITLNRQEQADLAAFELHQSAPTNTVDNVRIAAVPEGSFVLVAGPTGVSP